MIIIDLNRLLRFIAIATLCLLALNISPGQAEKLTLQPLPLPAVDPDDMGTAFTYQGRLMDGGNPANGVYDFVFYLFDDPLAGSQLDANIIPDQVVVNGLFTVELDYGAAVFNGFDRWLEIAVKPDAAVDHITLTPRQKINPTPYATFARTIYRKTVVVKPVTPTGSFTDNGKVLLGALNDITDASADNRYLIKIEPGVYDLFEDSLEMKPYVDIEGSGRKATLIKRAGFTDFSDIATESVVTASSDCQIRSLTVYSDATYEGTWYEYANAIFVPPGQQLDLEGIDVVGKDASDSTYGMYAKSEMDNYPSLKLQDVGVYALYRYPEPTGSENQYGIYLEDMADLQMTDSTMEVIGKYYAYGIFNNGTATLKDTKIAMIGGTDTVGIINLGNLILKDTELTTSGGTNVDALINSGSARIEESRIRMDGDAITTIHGIWNSDSNSSLDIRQTQVEVVAKDNPNTITVNGILNSSTNEMVVRDATVLAQGGKTPNVAGIYSTAGASGQVLDSSVTSTGGYTSNGLFNLNAVTTLEDSQVTVRSWEDETSYCAGLHAVESSASLTVRNSTVYAECNTPSSYPEVVNAIQADDSGLIQVFDSLVTATNGMHGNVTGIQVNGNTLLLALTNTKVYVYGQNSYNYGIQSGITPLVIKDSHIYAQDGGRALGVYVLEDSDTAAPDVEVTGTVIRAEGADTHDDPDPRVNENIGILFQSDGRLDLDRDTIWAVPQFTGQPTPIQWYGGIGLLVDEGHLIMGNSKIVSTGAGPYMGVVLYYSSPLVFSSTINASEIYACWDEYCHTVAVNHEDAVQPANTLVRITSSMLYGGAVNWGSPPFECMWVTDHAGNGFGWPDLDGAGPVVENHLCP